MENPKVLLQDIGFDEEQITNAINSTNSNDIEDLIKYCEYNIQQSITFKLKSDLFWFQQHTKNQISDNPQPQQQQKQAQQLDSITKYISEEHVAFLMSENHSKNVAEISQLISELKIVVTGKKIQPEEAAFKGRELQQKLLKKGELLKNRLLLNKKRKELLMAKPGMIIFKRQIRNGRIVKKRKEAMFGNDQNQNNKQQQQQQNYSLIELFELGIKQIEVAYFIVPYLKGAWQELFKRIFLKIHKNTNSKRYHQLLKLM